MKHIIKKSIALLLSALMALSCLTGCSNNSGKNEKNTEANQETNKKDSLTVIVPNDFTTLDPYKTPTAAEIHFCANIYDPLTFTDMEGTHGILAESWEASEDGLQYTFHLREGVKFQNGVELTADDVIYSIERFMTESWMTPYSFMIDNAEKIDSHTVKVNLKYAYGSFLSLLNYLLISNEAYMTEKGDVAAQEPMGTGAYKLVKWNVGQNLQLEANPDYFQGEAPIKNLNMKIVNDPSTAYVEMETGKADFYFNANPVDYDQAKADGKLGTDDCIGSMYYYVTFNVDRLPKEVRQALCLCLDREELNVLCTDGTGIIVDQPLLKGQEGYVEDLGSYTKNIEKAKQLLSEAGYPDGMDLTFFYGETAQNAKLAEALQASFSKIGVNLTLESCEAGAWFALFGEGNYDISRGGYPMEETCTDLSFYDMYHGENGTYNVSRINDPKLNEMLQNAREEQDKNKRDEMYQEITKYVDELACQFPTFYSRSALIYNKDLKGAHAINSQRYLYHELSW